MFDLCWTDVSNYCYLVCLCWYMSGTAGGFGYLKGQLGYASHCLCMILFEGLVGSGCLSSAEWLKMLPVEPVTYIMSTIIFWLIWESFFSDNWSMMIVHFTCESGHCSPRLLPGHADKHFLCSLLRDNWHY